MQSSTEDSSPVAENAGEAAIVCPTQVLLEQDELGPPHFPHLLL